MSELVPVSVVALRVAIDLRLGPVCLLQELVLEGELQEVTVLQLASVPVQAIVHRRFQVWVETVLVQERGQEMLEIAGRI